MPAVVVEIADAVTDALNGATLSQTFTAERLYVPVHELDDLATLRVSVVPASATPTLLNRGAASMNDYTIDVGVQKRLTVGVLTTAQIDDLSDPLMVLAEEVVDLFFGKPLAGVAGAVCVAAVNAPIFDPAHLDQMKVFTSVVRLTFRKGR